MKWRTGDRVIQIGLENYYCGVSGPLYKRPDSRTWWRCAGAGTAFAEGSTFDYYSVLYTKLTALIEVQNDGR